ncbi:MAG: hypothetical protein Q9190_001364 [Brigantiaea leucoxantha]
MSGTNPFRRNIASNLNPLQIQSQAAGQAEERLGAKVYPLNTDIPRTTKTKTVRIVSPHYSRSKDNHGIPRTTSPPLQESFGTPQSDAGYDMRPQGSPLLDPFSAQSDEGGSTGEEDEDEMYDSTMTDRAEGQMSNRITLGVSANPFSRTPASHSNDNSKAAPAVEGSQSEDRHDYGLPSTARPHYDVDDFKRLLLTGEKLKSEKSAPPTHSNAQGPSAADANSNTDASSVSKQSIFEPHHEAHQESPRTSIEVSPSDDERHGLVQASSSARSWVRPSAPASRHGKLVKQNVPQAVLSESLPSSPLGLASGLGPLDKSQSPTDLNKPLPSPPGPSSPKLGISVEIEKEVDSHQNTQHKDSREPKANYVQTRNPPPPPARRHSLTKSTTSSVDSSSQRVSVDTTRDNLDSQSEHDAPNMRSRPPIPPPPRRAGISNVKPELGSARDGSYIEASQFSSHKPRPPVPPSRTSSTSSIKRPVRVSTAPTSPSVPPPPPPRRRGSSQTSQGSFSSSRFNGEYQMPGGERHTTGSVSSFAPQASTTIAESQPEEKDIMADLSALQREVDELRGKFGR